MLYNLMNSLSVSKTRAKESALSSALSVMISSFPAHFRIFDMLENKNTIIRIKHLKLHSESDSHHYKKHHSFPFKTFIIQ